MHVSRAPHLRVVALLSVLAVLLAACGGDSGLDSSASDAAAGGGESESGGDAAGGGGGESGGTIEFVHWRGEDVEVLEGIIAQFEEETGIEVNQNVLPSDSYNQQVQASLVGGEGADVFTSFPGSQFFTLAESGVFADLTDVEFADRFVPELIEQGAQDGRQLAFPYQLVFNIPVYNVALFEQYGLEPPADWEGFLNVCRTLRENGVDPIVFAGNVSPSQFINPMLMNNAPEEDIFEQVEAGERQVTEDWFVTTLSQIAELQANECFQQDPLGTRQEGAIALFAQGNAGMLALGSYAMATVAQQNPDLEMGLLAPITVSADEAEWEGINTTTFLLGVNANSDQQEQATQFLEFLTRPEVASEYANGTGQLLTLEEVDYQTPALQAQTEWIDRTTRFQPRFLIRNGEIAEGLLTSVEQVLGGTPPEEAAATYQALIDRARGA